MLIPHKNRYCIIEFLQELRQKIIDSFEQLEPTARFTKKPWHYQEEGGGEIGLLRGQIFEKVAVNWSGVGGKKYPLDAQEKDFFATGLSVITHMTNPHMPTAHFNLRFIETEKKCWFGGGYDLTPMGFYYEEDKLHFHQVAKNFLNKFDEKIYPQFAQNAKDYFYIPHRKKERGVGGIFFDYLQTEDFALDLAIWQAVGHSFLPALLPIYQKRIMQPYSELERNTQLEHRAHYVEFNLLYDRGTRFGFQSSGNPEAILCSLPPLVKW